MNLHDAILEAREGRGRDIRCPAHEDKTPSLAVRPGHNGAVLIHCFAGCPTATVLAAEGLGWPDVFAPQKASTHYCRPKPAPARLISASADADEKRQKRAKWPPFETPTAGDLDQIARVRGLGLPGLELAVARGILWTISEYREHRCWVVTDSARMAAQARRLDGLKFETANGATKAMTLPGSYGGWPIGAAAVEGRHRSILLVEGGPDLLAAHQFIIAAGRQKDAATVGLMGAANRISENALATFKNRRVRIIEHADQAGVVAGLRWAEQLRGYAACTSGVSFEGLKQADGCPVADLNDAAHISAEDFETNRFLWEMVP